MQNMNESETPFDLYYIGRTDDSLNLLKEVTLIHVTTEAPSPPFLVDSIGIFDQSTSLVHVDQYVQSIGKVEDEKLALTLIKPWKTEIEKVRSIFTWMVKNISYDYVGLKNGNPVYETKDILLKHISICEGYANLFVDLCKKVNIECNKIIGITPEGKHAWNTVRIDKKWYLLDATWGNRFFILNPEIFIQDHFPNKSKWTLLTSPISTKDWKAKYLANLNSK